jgi:pimeloyl-ACP methyl ester carboxylesterase
MIPGLSQTAEQFKYQIQGLCDRYRTIAVDMRGHGESEKPDFGYKISRLAKDVYDVLSVLDLNDVVLLGHSMGCSVIWCYWDMFGSDRLSKLILVDQMPFMMANPAWSDEERTAAGATYTPEILYGAVNTLAGLPGPQADEVMREMIRTGTFTSAADEETKNWCVERSLRMPHIQRATLLYNHATQDWRDVIPRINIPTLIVGGRVSRIPWQSQVWIHEEISGSQLEIFEEGEGGQHYMFIEAAEKFNRVVAKFIG